MVAQSPKLNSVETLQLMAFGPEETTAIFDIRVTDLDNPSQRGSDAKKTLARHEREKKAKYLEACKHNRQHFTPLVFSIDGFLGSECNAAVKCVSLLIAKKWNRTYSQVCGFVRSRLCIALVRSSSCCLRWDCNRNLKQIGIPWDSGSGLGLYR